MVDMGTEVHEGRYRLLRQPRPADIPVPSLLELFRFRLQLSFARHEFNFLDFFRGLLFR